MILDESEIKIKYEIPVGEKRKYYFRNELLKIQILDAENQVLEDVLLNLNEISNTDLDTCSISTYF